jgi:hypothetical protein
MHPVPINKSRYLSIADDGFGLGGAPEAVIKTENPVGEEVPMMVRIFHHKTGAVVWHPLEEATSDGIVAFYPGAEAVLARLLRRGLPMILKPKRDNRALHRS